MRIIAYARFSPRPNAAECESCKAQLEDIRYWARANKHTVVAEYWDDALSGGDDWASRPGLRDAKIAAKRGQAIVVRRLDRLFRDAGKAIVFRALLAAKGVRIVSIQEPGANGDDPQSRFMANIFCAMAQMQREMISQDTSIAMQRKQRNGQRMSRWVPYGWTSDPTRKGYIIEDPREQMILRHIRQLRKRGWGCMRIAKRLVTEGVEKGRGTKWTPNAVSHILQQMKKQSKQELKPPSYASDDGPSSKAAG